MKINFLQTMATPKGVYQANTVHDIPDARAAELINSKIAEPVRVEVVTAELPDGQTAEIAIKKPCKGCGPQIRKGV